jgi:thiamine-monophosphate kinase
VRKLSTDPVRTVGDVGEQELIGLFTSPQGVEHPDDGVLIGPGDDAAVLVGSGPVVVSTDALVDGQHFRLDWSTPGQVGAKAIVANAADVVSMGARVSGFVVSLTCPPDTATATLIGVRDGMRDAAARYGARVVGGDLTAGDQLVIAVTAIGAMDDRTPVRLSTPRPGDVLAVSGPLGGSAAGLALLTAGVDGFASLVAAHCAPDPRLDLALPAVAAEVHAMTDISDGLWSELGTMARTSGLCLRVDPAAVPGPADLIDAARVLDVDPRLWRVSGGEDHELLAAFAPARLPAGWTAVGSVHPAGTGPPVTVTGMDAAIITGWHTF